MWWNGTLDQWEIRNKLNIFNTKLDHCFFRPFWIIWCLTGSTPNVKIISNNFSIIRRKLNRFLTIVLWHFYPIYLFVLVKSPCSLEQIPLFEPAELMAPCMKSSPSIRVYRCFKINLAHWCRSWISQFSIAKIEDLKSSKKTYITHGNITVDSK